MEPIRFPEKNTCPASYGVESLEGFLVHGKPPYEHVEFLCRNVENHSRHYDMLRSRFLWHHGRPGLLLFHPGHPLPPPLHHWQSHGEEAGETYISLFPSDDFGRHFFFAAPTADLLLIRCLTEKLAAVLPSSLAIMEASQSDWVQRLILFRAELDAIPKRLHYDDITCRKEQDKCIFYINNVLIGSYLLSEVIFELSACGARIIYFPLVGSDTPAGCQHVLDLGNSRGLHKTSFKSFSAFERVMFHDMISAIPNFLDHFCYQQNISPFERKELTKQAKKLRHELGKFCELAV